MTSAGYETTCAFGPIRFLRRKRIFGGYELRRIVKGLVG